MADGLQRSSSPTSRQQGTEGVLGFLGRDMAVDLGTANTLVYVRGRGVVLNEPSVVAINTLSGAILAVGAEAKRMIGRTPSHIQAVRPLKDGVIADFDVTEKMLRYFIQKVHKRRLLAKPRVVICVPSGITGVEQRAVEEATIAAGARRAYIIEEPMAAAIGAGLPIHEPTGNMVVDIGGGTTEVAVISLGGIVTSTSIRIGGDELDEAIIQHVKKEYSLLLGERTSEAIKLAIASVFPMQEELVAEIKGRDLVSGLPKTITISAEEIRRAIEEPDRRSSLHPILDSPLCALDRPVRMESLDPGCSPRAAIKPVLVNEIEHEICRAPRESPHTLAALAAEHRFELAGIVFESRDDLTAVATRGAPARCLGVHDDHVDACFRQMQCSRQSQIAGPDNEHVGPARALDRWNRGRRHRSVLPQIRKTRADEYGFQQRDP